MIYPVQYSHISYEASSVTPFSRKKITKIAHWAMDQPTEVTLINGRKILVTAIDWSNENWPVQLLVDSAGIRHRFDTVLKL